MRILHLDIETAPNLVYTWGLWNQNVSINQIVEPGYTLCWSAKWHGKSGVMFDSIQESKPKKMVEGIHSLLEEANVVVHYNGQRFDIPRLNSEFLLHNLNPPSQYKQLDLLKTTRSQFGFASNKLDYVVQQLEIGSKVKHLGMDLWRDCMAGDEKSWRIMKRYNMQDVKLLEKYYTRILPWIKNHPNWGVYLDSERPICRNCGSEHVIKKGVEPTNTFKYQRYKCVDCGTPLRGRKSIEKANIGLTV